RRPASCSAFLTRRKQRVAAPDRGAVWLVDLGMAGKVRPCLVLSVPAGVQERALVTLVAGTTSVRGTRFEVAVQARFLQAGVFDAQNILTVPKGCRRWPT